MTTSRYRSRAALNWAFAQRAGSSSENHLLIVMASMVADKPMQSKASGTTWPEHHCWASLETLAEATGLDERTVGKSLARLVAGGYLKQAGIDGKTRKVKVYQLAVNGGNFVGIETPSMPALLQRNTRKFAQTEAASIKERDRRKQEERKGTRRLASSETFPEWRERIKLAGEKAIPDDDPIYDYTEPIGITLDMLQVHWIEFANAYNTTRKEKKYTDWRAAFRNSVRGNWFGLWAPDGEQMKWTNKGLQALNSLRARDRATERQSA